MTCKDCPENNQNILAKCMQEKGGCEVQPNQKEDATVFLHNTKGGGGVETPASCPNCELLNKALDNLSEQFIAVRRERDIALEMVKKMVEGIK